MIHKIKTPDYSKEHRATDDALSAFFDAPSEKKLKLIGPLFLQIHTLQKTDRMGALTAVLQVMDFFKHPHANLTNGWPKKFAELGLSLCDQSANGELAKEALIENIAHNKILVDWCPPSRPEIFQDPQHVLVLKPR